MYGWCGLGAHVGGPVAAFEGALLPMERDLQEVSGAGHALDHEQHRGQHIGADV